MGSMNLWIGIGNLGRDADLRYTPAGHAVANFSMACSESWTDKQGDKQERTEWVRVVLWGKAAEALAEYLVKGKQVAVQGPLQTREWEDKDGNKRYTTEIKAQRVTLLGGGSRRNADEDQRRGDVEVADTGSQAAPVETGRELTDDDIPF